VTTKVPTKVPTKLALSEKQLLGYVLEVASRTGWLAAHFGSTVKIIKRGRGIYTWIGEKGATGYPDVTLIRRDRLIFAELKTGNNRTTPAQDIWLDALGRVPGIEVYLWTDADLEAIAEVLR